MGIVPPISSQLVSKVWMRTVPHRLMYLDTWSLGLWQGLERLFRRQSLVGGSLSWGAWTEGLQPLLLPMYIWHVITRLPTPDTPSWWHQLLIISSPWLLGTNDGLSPFCVLITGHCRLGYYCEEQIIIFFLTVLEVQSCRVQTWQRHFWCISLWWKGKKRQEQETELTASSLCITGLIYSWLQSSRDINTSLQAPPLTCPTPTSFTPTESPLF